MLRVDVSKKSITALSSNDGEFVTSTTTAAPLRTSASPAPVRVLTPVFGDAATASWPARSSSRTTLEPMRPVPPRTTILTAFSLLGALPLIDAPHDGVRARAIESVEHPSRVPSAASPRLADWSVGDALRTILQGLGQLIAGADVELREDLAQVVLDSTGADEQLAGDLRVGLPVCRQLTDL